MNEVVKRLTACWLFVMPGSLGGHPSEPSGVCVRKVRGQRGGNQRSCRVSYLFQELFSSLSFSFPSLEAHVRDRLSDILRVLSTELTITTQLISYLLYTIVWGIVSSAVPLTEISTCIYPFGS